MSDDILDKETADMLSKKMEIVFNAGYKEAIVDLLDYLEKKADELEEQENEIQ